MVGGTSTFITCRACLQCKRDECLQLIGSDTSCRVLLGPLCGVIFGGCPLTPQSTCECLREKNVHCSRGSQSPAVKTTCCRCCCEFLTGLPQAATPNKREYHKRTLPGQAEQHGVSINQKVQHLLTQEYVQNLNQNGRHKLSRHIPKSLL